METISDKITLQNCRSVHLTVDCRLAFDMEHGAPLRKLIKTLAALNPGWKWTLMGLSRELSVFAPENAEFVEFKTTPFSLHEQILFKRKIPECDLFWSPHYNIPFFATKARHTLFTLSGLRYAGEPRKKSFFCRLWERKLLERALKTCRYIIVPSFHAFNRLKEEYPDFNERCSVVLPGADTYDPERPSVFHKKRKYLLSLCYTDFEKNLLPALEAYNLIKDKTKADFLLPVLLIVSRALRAGAVNCSILWWTGYMWLWGMFRTAR